MLLTLPILLYVFDQSPYYKRSYINPARDHVSFFCAKTISNYYDVPDDYLQVNIPKIVRLLRAERIVIGTYTSPDRLEALLLFSISHAQCIFSRDDEENTSISIIATTLLELFQGGRSARVRHRLRGRAERTLPEPQAGARRAELRA